MGPNFMQRFAVPGRTPRATPLFPSKRIFEKSVLFGDAVLIRSSLLDNHQSENLVHSRCAHGFSLGGMGKKSRSKQISKSGILGQRGINLIERVVLGMGSRWTPSGPNETGIDGYIELYDPSDSTPLGRTLAVQSKAVSAFESEDGATFSYWAQRRDLEYWLAGNMPVILVVSRPDTNEAYWVSIQDCFGTSPKSTRVVFSKATDTFNVDCFQELTRVAQLSSTGLYFAPLPRKEFLYTNLLPLTEYPETIFFAPTQCNRPSQVWKTLRETNNEVSGAWIIQKKQLISFHDLRAGPWSAACEAGAVEKFSSDEWALSSNLDQRRSFVRLLNQALRDQLFPKVRYWGREDCYAYAGRPSGTSLKDSYRSLQRNSQIAVVTRFENRYREQTFEWYRHIAFRGQFRRFDDDWFLEITPTYRFTSAPLRIPACTFS